jgi:hypothetical protein
MDSIFNTTPVRSKASPRSKASARMNKTKSKSPSKGIGMMARLTDAFNSKINDPNATKSSMKEVLKKQKRDK